LVARELIFGPKRFTDLRAGLPGISPNVLSQRLDELEQSGVVRKRKLPPPVSAAVYDLTEWGKELDIVITELGRWGARSPVVYADPHISGDSMIMSLRTMFQPGMAQGVQLTCQLRLGDDEFQLTVDDGSLTATRGGTGAADVVIETSPAVLAAVVYGGHPLDAAIAAGELRVEGDATAAKTLVSLFKLPEPAALPR
jgi:DNA-binding HxlR family transcriptional regulator/putative sterol carrier protein